MLDPRIRGDERRWFNAPIPLLIHPSVPDAEGRVVSVTPASANWTYVGFDLYDLPDGNRIARETGDREVCIVIVSGRARVSAAETDYGTIGTRTTVFEDSPWSLYVPAHSRFAVAAEGPCEVAICSAPGTGAKPALLIPPADVPKETRGKGSNTRHVRNILADNDDRAESLLVVEVITPPGNWSSYPPHKHDRDDFPEETLLEESYYHRLTPSQGYGMQRVYTDDRSLDETLTFADRDVVLVPRGYHPVGAAHGLHALLSQRHGGPEARLALPQRPGPRVAPEGVSARPRPERAIRCFGRHRPRARRRSRTRPRRRRDRARHWQCPWAR